MFIRRVISVPNLQFIRNYAKEIDKVKKANFRPEIDFTKSSTLTGTILDKDDRIFEAIGATEELMCYIGLAREYAVEVEHDYIHKLKRIQTVLIDITTAISRYGDKEQKKIAVMHTKELEEWINKYSNELPPPELYIIPGGGLASTSLHVARSLCRRTERTLVPLVRDGGVDKEALNYLNRLSDFLFSLSRIAAKIDKRTESIYVPHSGEKFQTQ